MPEEKTIDQQERDVTGLLSAWRRGDEQALEELMPLVYDQLRRLAGRSLRHEPAGRTLQPTSLVHEAYLRLAQGMNHNYADRVHFFAVASRVMRHVLLDHAKARTSNKRGGRRVQETLEDHHHVLTTEQPELVLEIDRLLVRMQAFDTRKVQVVEMIFYGGMTYDEVAEALGVSAVTVHRELKMAKAWMRSELGSTPAMPTSP